MIALYNVETFVYYLDTLMNNISKRTIANYIAWRFIEETSKYLNDDFRELHDEQSTQCLYLTRRWYVRVKFFSPFLFERCKKHRGSYRNLEAIIFIV